MSRFSLAGRNAVVTGGSRGIGRAIALSLAQAGADVALTYRERRGEAEAVAEEIENYGRGTGRVHRFRLCARFGRFQPAKRGGNPLVQRL
jgi:NAD(P)-dependent dehydrogenase (short-subunit alcohol dehydrogenase family)